MRGYLSRLSERQAAQGSGFDSLRHAYTRVVSMAVLRMAPYWQARSGREKRLVILASVVLLVGGYYWGIWQPLLQALAHERSQLQQQQTLLTRMQAAQQQILAYRNVQPKAGPQGSLAQLISESAQQHQIVVTRIVNKDDSIQLSINPLSFNSLLAWLNTLHDEFGIQVRYLDVSADSELGVVRILIFEISTLTN
ncbi:MAG: type II secretion system protein GspM [Plesiomonas shigelloides]